MRLVTTPRRALVAEDLTRMNLPEDLWRAKLQDVQPSARSIIEGYLTRFDEVAEKGAGLVIRGEAGTGKTGISAVVAKEARARGYTVFFTTIFDLREAIRIKQMYDESLSIFDRCKEVDVLVLDNLVLSDMTDHYVNERFIEELITGRGARLKISILTSRVSRSDMVKEKYAKFVSAIEAYTVAISVTGEDLRKRRSEELKAAVMGTTLSAAKE